jgi:hypothetical protein
MRTAEAPTRSRRKHAVRDRARPVGTVSAWPDVLRAVQSDEGRSTVLGLYRAPGFTPDEFAHRREARIAIAEALTRLEDSLEFRCGRLVAEERARVQAARRRLERELWP